MMKYDELIKNLRECDACVRFCVEYCPKTSKLNKDGKCPTTLAKEAADAIEELQSQLPKWIPVAERLPDAHKNVLCCGSKGGQFVGWVSNHVANGKALAFVHGGYGRLITHWTPLPEPPKEE